MNIEKEKELYKQMDLLQIKEISTYRQQKNGTRIFQLPIKKYGQYIEVGSFKSGYVRRMNGGYTPYQLNKCEPNTEYHAEYKWCTIQRTSLKTGKYTQYIGKKRILIPHEVDRIDYLITYCLKNYYINGANQVEDSDGSSLKCEDTNCMTHFKYSGGQIKNMENGDIFVHEQHAYWNKTPSSVQVIVDGHRYNVK